MFFGKRPESLAAAALSIVALIPLIAGLFGGDWFVSRADTIASLVALGIVCLAISIINSIFKACGLNDLEQLEDAPE